MKNVGCLVELVLMLPFAVVGMAMFLALCVGFIVHWLLINTVSSAQRWVDARINRLFEGF